MEQNVGGVPLSEISQIFGSEGPRVRAIPPGPASRALAARLARVESRNVTFLGPSREAPFDAAPVFWTAARGANVRDADGNVFLDMTGAFGVAVAGHARPEVGNAMAAQASRLVHGMGDVHPPEVKVRLLERLAELCPWPDTRAFLASSGSEAVEAALKTALLATGRPGILAFEGGYHGLTLGALATTFRTDFRAPFAAHLHGGVHFAPLPDVLESEGREAEALERALARVDLLLARAESEGMPVGAVLLEPIQGRAGVRVPVPGFLAGVAERARRAGALVIFDEIFTGFGRTGHLFAHEAERRPGGETVVPDLMCVGKALGGGLPLSACLGDAAVMDAWPPSTGEALHTSTFLGHPLACATALAFLDVLEAESLPDRAVATGESLRSGLAEVLSGLPGMRGIRGRGLFLGLVLDGPGAPDSAGVRVAEEALRRGVIVLPAGASGEVVELSPPLVLTPAQVDAAVQILGASVRAALSA
jgi:4-aminobutyrate aminotransferase-like enzyme